jgi:GH18 family chitinase
MARRKRTAVMAGMPLGRLAVRLSCFLLLASTACTLSVLDDLASGGEPDGGASGDGDGDGDHDAGADPHCIDEMHNMGESDTDCGGQTTCPRCDTGAACGVDDDCASLHCANKKCVAPSCDDDIQNQGETGFDCGGPCDECDPCENRQRDEGEADVDCGGSCAKYPCITGLGCGTGTDCATGTCSDAVCRPGSRGAYWPSAEWLGAVMDPAQLPWSSVSHVFIAHAGISSSYECEFWTDAEESDSADPDAQQAAEDLVGYRDLNHPEVKLLLSIGGPLLSYRMSKAVTSTRRAAFVTSCIDLMAELGVDGIDIDWRFPVTFGGPADGPGSCREQGGCASAADAQNFTRLLSEFRKQLESRKLRGKLLTAVLKGNTMGGTGNVPYEYGSLATSSTRLLDWASIATFDMHGSGNVVDFGAPVAEVDAAMSFASESVHASLARDLFMGISFSGPYWSGVAEPSGSGIGNAGTPHGSLSFRTAKTYLANFSSQCDVRRPTSGDTSNRYLYCSGNIAGLQDLWISYDDADVVLNKAKYTRIHPYAGVNWWYQGEDTDQDELVTNIVKGMDEENPYFDDPLPLPARIQAENYDSGGEGVGFHGIGVTPATLYRSDNAGLEMCSDRDGGFDVPLTTDEWLAFTINPQQAGAYNVEFRVASIGAGDLHLEANGALLTQPVIVPFTDDAQDFVTVEASSPNVVTGKQVLKLFADSGEFALNWLRFSRGQSPYLDAPVALPGTVQAEFFDVGGQNVAYYDTSGSFFTIERYGPVELAADFDGPSGLHVEGIENGEWLEYTVEIAEAGPYNLELRASSDNTRAVHLEAGGVNVSGAVNIPVIGEFRDEWLTVEGRTQLALPAGRQVLRLAFDSGSGRLGVNWLHLTRGQVPYSGTPSAIPGTLQAEAFDLGGAELAYHDSTVGNVFVEYRQTDVDIEKTTDGGNNSFDVSAVAIEEWIEFTVAVAETGQYNFEARAASYLGNTSVRLETNDGTVLGTLAISATGGPQTWQTFSLPGVQLSAGTQILRVVFEKPGANYNWFRFSQ